jgi:methylthioribose-1-phosphate isomerase
MRLQIIKDISAQKNGAPVNILTHCNAGWLAFVDYGSATAPIYAAHRENIPVHVWVDETRPWNQGSKLTAWEMFQEGIAHTLITDNTGGHLMQHGMVDLVIVGSDRTTRTGDVANKIGTYLKALAANDNNVPFYVALPSSTIDWELRNGLREIPIEKRPGDEVKFISGLGHDNKLTTVLCGLPETPASNYAFDVTPARLVNGIITERGIAAASEESLLELFPEFV